MNYIIEIKSFSFKLIKPLITSHGALKKKNGWLIKIKCSGNNKIGWGEISPIKEDEFLRCENILNQINQKMSREEIENGIITWPKSIGFGFGAALAEIDCEIGLGSVDGWLKAPQSSILLDSKESVVDQVKDIINSINKLDQVITFKLKVGLNSNASEEELVRQILNLLPTNSKLRLDANEGWEYKQAEDWANNLKDEFKVEWIEQPLGAENIEGLLKLSKIISIALDESLVNNPSLINTWTGWQVRRPLLEGDPRLLLNELKQGAKFRSLSTTFETGIGKRWINHLAALQIRSSTPSAPGLGPGWTPSTSLFSEHPEIVWQSV